MRFCKHIVKHLINNIILVLAGIELIFLSVAVVFWI